MNAPKAVADLGLTLPELPDRLANYLWFKQAGHLIWISGQGPRNPDRSFISGKVGRDFGLDEAYRPARLVGLDL